MEEEEEMLEEQGKKVVDVSSKRREKNIKSRGEKEIGSCGEGGG